LFSILMPAVIAWSSGCAEQPESVEHKCMRLRDHLLDLRGEGLPEQDRAAHREALRQALGGFVEECKSAMSSEQIECGLKSDDITASAACTAIR
jgi:hypothetical protein